MRRTVFMLALAAAASLAACGDRARLEPPVTPAPPGDGVETTPAPEPFVCPEGMPKRKCDDLKAANAAQ